jgi:hypothetical protein
VYSGPITVSATETLEAMAVETGDTNSPVATAIYTIPVNFSISARPNALTLAAGQSATSTVTISPINGFNQAVSFGCSGLSAGLSCAFAPSSVAVGGTSANSILTITAGSSAAAHRGMPAPIPATSAAFLVCLLGFRRRRSIHLGLFLAGVVLGMTGISGCNSYQGSIPAGPTGPVTTTVMVTATAGAIQQAAALTVTVK